MNTEKNNRQEKRTSLIKGWYVNVFPTVASFVKRNNGDLELAKEIFQEAVVIYYEKSVDPNFQIPSSENAYLFGIAKNRFFKKLNEQSKFDSINRIDLQVQDPNKLDEKKLMNFLSETGGKCMDLLQAFYYEKLSMKHIANRFGFKSERSATVQKYKCLEKMRVLVEKKSLKYEDFIE